MINNEDEIDAADAEEARIEMGEGKSLKELANTLGIDLENLDWLEV